MRQKFRIVGLRKLHPGRTAGSKLRQRRTLLCHTGKQFRCFFDDSHIRCKVRVKHDICTKCPKQSNHLSFRKSAGHFIESFPKRNTDGRRCRDNNNLFRICNRLLQCINFAFFSDRIYRTDICALPAVYTDRHISCLGKVVIGQY